jgi:hypothetical protein
VADYFNMDHLETIQGRRPHALRGPPYRDNARWFQKILAATRGLDLAADIIERVFGEGVE